MVGWVNFKCRGVLLNWIIVGQWRFALAAGAGGGSLDIFSLVCHFSFLSPSLWETARYSLKYCLKGPLSPKQPTDQPIDGDGKMKMDAFLSLYVYIYTLKRAWLMTVQFIRAVALAFGLCV